MAEYFVRNSLGNVSQDGSQLAPFRSLAALHTALVGNLSGHTIRLFASDIFDEDVNSPGRTFTGSNWTMDAWSTMSTPSARPTITRAKRDLTWSFDQSNNVWVSSPLSNVTYGGCITEDGEAMRWTAWAGSRSSTAAEMPSAGVACFDVEALCYIIRPSSGDPSSHVYAATSGVDLLRITTAGLFSVKSLKFELSGAGLTWGYPNSQSLTGGWLIEDVEIAHCGGMVSSSAASYYGNALGIIGCTGANGRSTVRRVLMRDIWDSGYSPQVFSENGLVQSVDAYELEILRCGLAGAEFSVSAQPEVNQSRIIDCSLKRSVVRDSGKGWSGRRFNNGDGVTVFTNNAKANCYLQGIDIDQNEITGCVNTGIQLYQTNGTGNVARRNNVSSCNVGLGATSRAGYQATTSSLVENFAKDCNTGLTMGRASSGLSGSVVRIDNNVVLGCKTGASDITNAGDAALLRNNLIVGSTVVGVTRSGAGTLTKSTNALYGNTVNYGGTATQGTDIILAADPAIDATGNASLSSPIQVVGTTIELAGDKAKMPDQMYVGHRPRKVYGPGYRLAGA